MKRRSIKVIRARLEDIEVGDVVNRTPDAEFGWFTVDAVSTLFNGHLQLADETEQMTVSGDHKDMVGLQLVEEILLDANGVIVPATPAAATATAPPVIVAESATDPAPTTPPPTGDPASEAATAAAIATEMRGNPGAPADLDLGLVVSLLEDLDVGEAPAIIAPGPAGRPSALPANAVAVDGGTLPEQPSYRNPVVVPEGTMLPRRSRAA